MDLIRQVLLLVEGREYAWFLRPSGQEGLPEGLSDRGFIEVDYHVALLVEADYLDALRLKSGGWQVSRLTWKGHEFLDTVREDAVWAETKNQARKAGGWGVGLLLDIGKAVVKAEAKKRLGLPLD